LILVPGARVTPLGTIRSKELDGFELPKEAWKVATWIPLKATHASLIRGGAEIAAGAALSPSGRAIWY